MTGCLIYALGGGLGHVQRAGALARALEGRGIDCTVLANSALLTPGWRARQPWLVDLSGLRDPALLRRRVREAVSAGDHAALVVDTFPRGLLGELADLSGLFAGPRGLIGRELAPVYGQRPMVMAARRNYDLHLLPGEGRADRDVPTLRTEPWLICDADACLPPQLGRARLGCPADGRPVVVLPASGTRTEMLRQRELHGLLSRWLGDVAHLRLLHPARRLPPLLRLLPAVTAVVGAGGYNTVAECRATGTPLLATARPRRYDRQDLRLRPAERWQNPIELHYRLRALLDRARPSFRHYRNGVHPAAAAVAELIDT